MGNVERNVLKLIYEMCGEYVALNWYSKEGVTAAYNDSGVTCQIKEFFSVRNDKFNLLCEMCVVFRQRR
jgi:hypothetical protein